MKTRWVCPKCSGARLAPTRMRADDARRYCFPCSEETGRLVLREAPTLARRREEKEERRRAAERAAREREKEKEAVCLGTYPTSLRVVWAAMLALPSVREVRVPRDARLTIKNRRASSSSGSAVPWGVVIRAGRDKHDALAVLLHELAHLVAFARHNNWIHDSRFSSTFAQVAAEWIGLPALPAYIDRSHKRRMTSGIARYMRSVAEGLDPAREQATHDRLSTMVEDECGQEPAEGTVE